MTAAVGPPRTRGRAFIGAVRAEASKLWSLPATWLLLAATLALTIALSVAFAASVRSGATSAARTLDLGVLAVTWTQCGFFLLGVIAATSEHVGGQVRTTLVAIPDRIAQRLAATAALGLMSFAAGVVTVAVSITVALLATGTAVGDVGLTLVLRLTFSAAGYLALMTVLSSALGVLVRRAVPTAAVLLVYLLILSPILQDQRWYLLPDIASYTLWFATVPDGAPPALTAWLVIAAWTLVFLLSSVVAANRRDT